MRKRLFITLFIIGLFIFMPVFVFCQTSGNNSAEIDTLNQEITARKDKIKQLEETIAKYNKNIQAKQLEAVSLNNQLSILENRMAKAETDIELTQAKIDEAKLEIEALNLSIQDKETVIAKQKKIIAKMVADINADKERGFLEILLTHNSFSEFFNQIQYSMNVYTDLGQSAKILRLAKEDLQAKQQLVEDRKKSYEDLKAQLEDKKAQLADQRGYKQNLLIQTKSSELKYKTLLSSLKQQYQAVEGEIRTYEDRVRKKLEEQERNNAASLGDGTFTWPVISHVITATFHDPDYPFRRVFEHSGIDIRASQGTAVRAAATGYVARAKRCTLASCYSYVLLVHNGNLSSLYGHLSSISVGDDEFVGRGDVIGYSGGTPGMVGSGPFVTGPHLHFEIRSNGIPVDPMGYL
jgi:murein DD-endopeptidase MepM/ murein hydrolase activator NlpD